jgi:hypothetical protein
VSKNKNRITAARVQPGMSIRNNKEWVAVSHVSIGDKNTTLRLVNGRQVVTVHCTKLQFRAAGNQHSDGRTAQYCERMTEDNRADSDNGCDLMRHK